jgi:hypothetical protein
LENYEEVNRDRMANEGVVGSRCLEYIRRLDSEKQGDRIDQFLNADAALFFEKATTEEGVFSNSTISELRDLLEISPDVADKIAVLEILDEKMEDPKQWRSVIERHSERQAEKHEFFIEEIEPRLREKVKEKIAEHVENGYLPTSKERAFDLIDRLEFYPADAFYNADSAGEYHFDTHGISIILGSLFPTQEEFENGTETLGEVVDKQMHTYLRSLDSSEIERRDRFGDDPLVGTTSAQRVGLRFHKGKPYGIAGYDGSCSRLNWLNEAVTETANRHMLGESFSADTSSSDRVYAEEIDLYYALLGKTGIDEDMFRAAYFEDFDPNAEEGTRVPEWKSLKIKIDQALGADGLTKLDDIVASKPTQRGGAEAGIEYLEGLL